MTSAMRFSKRVRRVDGHEQSVEAQSAYDARLSLDANERVTSDKQYVLYWMTAARRPRYNLALERAAILAARHGLPLVVLEALRVGYEHASARFHTFVLQGMADNARHFAANDVTYLPYLEPQQGAGKGLVQTLAQDALLVVTDDYPCFFLPRMLSAFADVSPCPVEAVDGNGVYPMHDAERHFTRAHSLRRHLQKRLPNLFRDGYQKALPSPDPLVHLRDVHLPEQPELPDLKAWPMVDSTRDTEALIADLPIDHSVAATKLEGGFVAAGARLRRFITERLASYGAGRNHPDDDGASGLSPYLHFGHIGAQEVFAALAEHHNWDESHFADKVTGQRHGFWGLPESTEAFLDELITWREIGFNACLMLEQYDAYESLPEWAQKTLNEHRDDPRDVLTLETLENAETPDPVWNAAQRQLREEGVIHNYLRMLWGKNVLAWSKSPPEAAARLIYLNDKYALDGRDPNSYSGIFWVLGRYDRAWGPERPIFGKVRYMTSESTKKKLRLKKYLARFSGEPSLF